MRETEFGPSQNEDGHQAFRNALPIRPGEHNFYAAADGQLGGIMKVYREWRISGDTDWLQAIWPQVKRSLDYCIETWDPGHGGLVEEPHHNTYDIEFWGPDGMCSSFYLGALAGGGRDGPGAGRPPAALRTIGWPRPSSASNPNSSTANISARRWSARDFTAPSRSRPASSTNIRPTRWRCSKRKAPNISMATAAWPTACSGAWMALVCGVGQPLDRAKVTGHLRRHPSPQPEGDLAGFANPQRPTYAAGDEGGLLLCTWPKGGALSLPFVYSNEVWTGIEYQCASHMIRMGLVAEGLEVVRTCRQRYDGRVRNPFDEYECGHWYARAMSSYALLEALSGARFDAVEKMLYLKPAIKGDFRSFLSTATGYGTVGVKGGKPFLEVVVRTDSLSPHRLYRCLTRD